jgi:hypothetical protein
MSREGADYAPTSTEVQTSHGFHRHGGVHVCTLVLPNQHGGVIHAVTGQGETAEAAQANAVELANRWRRTVT